MLNGAGSEDEEDDIIEKKPPTSCDDLGFGANPERVDKSAVIDKTNLKESHPSNSSGTKPKLPTSLKVQSAAPGMEDEVDRSLPGSSMGSMFVATQARPDPEGQTGSSPSSPSNSGPDDDHDAISSRHPPRVSHDKQATPVSVKSASSSCDMSSVKSPQPQQRLSTATLDITKSPAFLKLKAELDSAKEQLQSKEEQVDKLSKIRDEVEAEVQELTASLFTEANKMVGDANEKRMSTEKCLAEATMKIDGLETEVTALKALVLTSTPSQPNRHLHPQLSNSSSKKSSPSSSRVKGLTSSKDHHRRQGSDSSASSEKGPSKRLSFSLNASPRSNSKSNKSSPMTNEPPPPVGSVSGAPIPNLVVGAGGLVNGDLQEDGVSVLSADEDDVLIDPAFRQEYMAWKKEPTLERISSQPNPFLDRLYREDIDPCLDFPCENPRLVEAVQRGIQEQTVCIAPLRNEELAQGCPLLNHDRVLCKYVVKLAPSEAATPDSPSNSTSSTNLPPTPPVPREFRISQLARNRIASVCNLLNYLDYIKKGLVKSHVNDVYREILALRKGIALARLGYSPD